MKASEIRELTLEEMSGKENDLAQELFNLRFQHGTDQLENTEKLKMVKRDIARIKTLIREKKIQQ